MNEKTNNGGLKDNKAKFEIILINDSNSINIPAKPGAPCNDTCTHLDDYCLLGELCIIDY